MLLNQSQSVFTPLSMSGIGPWYDCSDITTITKAYASKTPTGSGTISTTTITASADVSNIVPVGSKLRIGGTDIYTVSAVSTTTITTIETLTATYSAGAALALDEVTLLTDKAPTVLNATTAGAALNPTYVPNNQNGLSIIDFIQLGSCLQTPAFNLQSAFTIVMLIKLDKTIAAGDTFRRLFTMGNNNSGLFIRQSTSNLEMKATLTGQSENRSLLSYSAYDNTAYGIVISEVNLSNRTLYLQNGTSNTTTNTTAASFATPTQTWFIGDNNTVAAGGATTTGCKVAEVMFFNRSLATIERTTLNSYFQQKWGIS